MKKTLLLCILLAMAYTSAFAEDASDVALVKQGNALYKAGKLDTAIMYFKKAITVNPSNPFAYMNCGYAYSAKGENKTALTYLEKAYELQPEDQLKQGIEKLKLLEKYGLFKTENPLKFSKKIGFNISGLSDNSASYDLKTGLNTGLEAIYGFGELLSFQAGLFYTQKGGKNKALLDSYLFLDYIELPAAVKISFTPIKELLTGIYFGGSASVKIASKLKTAGIETDQSSAYELFDYGLFGGIEATYPVFGIFWISADLRFSQGLSDISKNTSIKVSNSLFTAYFGIIF